MKMRRIIFHFLSLFLFGLFSIYALIFIQQSLLVISYPWAVDYVEVPELNRALRIHRGLSLYPSWDDEPFLVSNYTPLFSYVHALFAEKIPSFQVGRWISFSSMLMCTLLIGRLTYRASSSVWAAGLAGAMFLSSHITWLWGSLLRVDSMAVMWNLCGLWIFYEFAVQKNRKKANVIAILCCVLAAFTRQSMIASFACICLYYLLEYKKLLYAIGIYALLGGIGVSLLLYTSDGWAYHHLVTANVNEFSWEAVQSFFGVLWSFSYSFALSGCIGVYLLWKNQDQEVASGARLLVYYLFLSFLVALTIGKIGASLNYLLELWAAISMCCAIGISHMSSYISFEGRFEMRRSLFKTGTAIFVYLLFLSGWQQLAHVPWFRMPKKDGGFIASAEPFWLDVQRQIQGLPFVLVDPWAPAENERASRSVRHYRPYPALWEARAMENISQNISSIQGPILVEDMNFTLQTREGLWIQPFEFAQLAKQKIWSPAPLHQALSQKRFSVLILLFDIEKDISSMVSGTRFLPETQKIMQENYQLRTREGNYWIYLPKEQ